MRATGVDDGWVSDLVQAAGGLVVRGRGATFEVAVVHRPAYDDWSFPKGKLHADESFEDAAIREVHEETGLRCSLGDELATTRYQDREGRRKIVRYWRMTPLDGVFEADREVDELRWMTFDEALGLLTYEHDRAVLRSVRS